MNIILQNYKNLITELIKNYFIEKIDNIIVDFDDNGNINNYINLLSSFDNNMSKFMCYALKNLLEEIDKNYCKSLERKRKYHIKYKTSRTILTIFGEITYYRYFYKSKVNNKCYCYVDRLLGLKKYDYFDPYIKAEILDYVSNNNYSETAEHINSLIGNRISIKEKIKYLSRQTVRNVIINEKISKPKIIKNNDTEELYIIADEKWIPTQNNNHKKVMQKSIVIFDGFNVNGKRKSLNNKMTFSGRTDNFIYEAINYIDNAYNTSKIKRFYMLGDGAHWIKYLKYYFNYNTNIEIIQGLDKFHFKQCLWRILPDKSVLETLSYYILKDNKEDFIRIIYEIIDCYPDRTEKIEEYKNYILNNWNNIQNLYKYNLSCPMESQISHTFASYFTSRPKAYNKNIINKLINLRLLKKNKYNIKELFLNNIKSDIIIDLNKDNLDFSMFDKTNIYTNFLDSNRKHSELH
ncbi:MAG: UPF0236 family protein [Bacilli bacterium]|nr:UPF0236 family protein [Bacilli bacterium]